MPLDPTERMHTSRYMKPDREPRRERDTKQPEPPQLEPIAQGQAKEESLWQIIAESLSLNPKDIRKRLIYKWLLPGGKNIIEDIIHMILFPNEPDPRVKQERGGTRMTMRSYSSYYKDEKSKDKYTPIPDDIGNMEPEILFRYKDSPDPKLDAEKVMSRMIDLVEKYRRATMKQLYTLAGLDTDYPMNYWGWRDLTGICVVEVRGGWLLKMPKMEDLRS